MAVPMTKNIVLPELSDEPLGYVNTDYWQCPSCKNVDHNENWPSIGYYDIPHFIKLLDGLPTDALVIGQETERYGTLCSLLRDRVAEHTDRHTCPSCGKTYEQEDITEFPQFDCVHCGENYTNSHDALVCCNESCPYMECSCLAGIRVEQDEHGNLHPLLNDRVRETTFYRCFCNRNDEEAKCGWMVCVVCHTMTQDDRNTWGHVCEGVPTGWPEVLVGVTVEEPVCTCETGFCCVLHGAHRYPHVLCEVV